MREALDYFKSQFGNDLSYHCAVIDGFRCQTSKPQMHVNGSYYMQERAIGNWYISTVATKRWQDSVEHYEVALLEHINDRRHVIADHEGWRRNPATGNLETFVPVLGIKIEASGSKARMIQLRRDRPSNAPIVLGQNREGYYFAGLLNTADLRMAQEPKRRRR